jgi:hypothetical protein
VSTIHPIVRRTFDFFNTIGQDGRCSLWLQADTSVYSITFHFIGASEQSCRYSQAESVCRLEVDRQPQFARKFDGKITRWCTLEGGATIAPAQVNAVADESAMGSCSRYPKTVGNRFSRAMALI